ncbi:MucR family transcriptional regulator [Labrys monachus]|uniref:MucR family transcriptional regulator n=1 Tax=Labrys monachus TaxID=217067 RepID=UPI0027D7971F|nr:MucR family transcriptional regulator [Labrys monachus]
MRTVDDNNISITADIVAAYVSNNSLAQEDLSKIIAEVYQALTRLARGEVPENAPQERPEPAVPIRKSVTPDFIICLEDGKPFKSLKRHLASTYGMTPDDYRAKWGLPADYPMVAPNYAQARSTLAKQMGLGHVRRQPPAVK